MFTRLAAGFKMTSLAAYEQFVEISCRWLQKTHSGLSLVTLASQVGGGSGQWPMKEFKLISPKEPAFRQLTMLFDE